MYNWNYGCMIISRGVPFVAQQRPERMEAIGKELAKGEYDIVLLQEVSNLNKFFPESDSQDHVCSF